MGQSASRARSGQRLRYADGSGEQLAKNRISGPPKSAEAPVDGAMDVRAAQAAAQPDREKNAAVDAMRKDPVLSSFLDQLGGSVAKRQVQEYYGEGIPDPIKRRKKGEVLEGDDLRLGITSLICLLEESRTPKLQKGGKLDVQALAASYEVDPEILEKVLHYCALPTYREDEDGKIIGSRSISLPSPPLRSQSES